MLIEIQPNSDIPLYTQLMYQIKKGILQKQLLPGDALPSVRNLASDLGINMHTVNKAYGMLAEEGLLQKSQKGFTVAVELPAGNTRKKQMIQARLNEVLMDAALFGFSDELISWQEELVSAWQTEKGKEGENK